MNNTSPSKTTPPPDICVIPPRTFGDPEDLDPALLKAILYGTTDTIIT